MMGKAAQATIGIFLTALFIVAGVRQAPGAEKAPPAGTKVFSATQADLSLTLSFAKEPRLGEQPVTVAVKNKAGKNVGNATVTLKARMTDHKMPTDDAIIPTKSDKKGTYAGSLDFSMGGEWEVSVYVARDKTPAVVFPIRVKVPWE